MFRSLSRSVVLSLVMLVPVAGVQPAFALSVARAPSGLPVQSVQWGSGSGGWGNDEAPASRPLDAEMSAKISRMENQMRQMNGQIEQLQNQIRRLEDQVRRGQEDTEFRFQELKGGAAHAPANPASAKPGKRSDLMPETMPASAHQGAAPAPLGQLSSSAAPVPNSQGSHSQVGQPLSLTPNGGAAPSSALASAPVAAASTEAKDDYDLAYGYVLRGDHELAEMSFKQFLAQYPQDKNVGSALYWLGESHYQRRQYDPAAKAFLKSFSDFPKGNKAPEALLRLGMSLKQMGKKEEACQAYAAITQKYPRASQAVKKRVQTEQRNAGC